MGCDEVLSALGVFGQCEKWVLPAFTFDATTKVKYTLTAFDDWLAKVKAGRETVRLLHDHADTMYIGDTYGGSMRLWRKGSLLCLGVYATDEWGRKAVLQMNSYSEKKLSFCADTIEAHHGVSSTNSSPRIIITKARITEVSLVDDGSFDTWFMITPGR
jgi:phage head maturation protease